MPKPHKPSGRTENLRPISVTPTIGKLLERMATDQLNHHLDGTLQHIFRTLQPII